MKIQFVGGVGTVTGSKHLVTQGDTRVLVDCGLYQGIKVLRERNWRALPFDPKSLDAVFLTHAHIDHSGLLPLLVRDGFSGPIYCTEATKDLCEILLRDAGHLQEEEARYANRKRFSKHDPAKPLYTEADARKVMPLIRNRGFERPVEIGEIEATLVPAGHILGAAGVVLRGGGTSIHMSGDLGRDDDSLMHPPEPPYKVDWVAMESTYGDRSHEVRDPTEALAEVLRRTVERGGILLIPAFAVGRTQSVLFSLKQAFERGLAPKTDIFINSPMATDVTALYRKHHAFHRLDNRQTLELCRDVHFVRSVTESKQLNQRTRPAVVISASGMLSGGRVLHHLRAFGPDPRNTILLSGYQAPGTRGAALLGGVDSLKIHGAYVPIKAEVAQIGAMSAHADREGLLRWLGASTRPPKGVFLVHGEPAAADHLRCRIGDELGLPARVPEYLDVVDLSDYEMTR